MGRLRLSLPAGELACRAILFDMDGVLVDSLDLIERHLRRWATGHGLDPDHVFASSHGRTNADLVRLVAPHLDAVTEAGNLVDQDIRDVAGLAPCPGAPALLDRLHAQDWAVVTSAYRPVAHARLAQARLPSPAVLVTAEDVTAGKPAPDPYLAAAERLGVPPRDCVVVEDAPSGVAAARAARARVIAVAGTTDGDLGADYTVDHLGEIRVVGCPD